MIGYNCQGSNSEDRKPENPEFTAWALSVPPETWAKYNIHIARIAWDAAVTEQEQRIGELQEQQREAVRFAHNAQDERDAALRRVTELEEKNYRLTWDADALRCKLAALEASKPAEGTWAWALEQMKAGKTVMRGDYMLREQEPGGGFYLCATGSFIDPWYWQPISEDFEARDWRLAPPATEPEEE